MTVEELSRLSVLAKEPAHSAAHHEELQSLVRMAVSEIAREIVLTCADCAYNVPVESCTGSCESCDRCPQPCRTCENFGNIELRVEDDCI